MFLEPLSSRQQVCWGWFQLIVYGLFSYVLLVFVVSRESWIPGLVFTSLIGLLHICLTCYQCRGWKLEQVANGVKLGDVRPMNWALEEMKRRHYVLGIGAVDAVMLALSTTALMGLNAHSGVTDSGQQAERHGVTEFGAMWIKMVIFFCQWFMTFVDLLILKGFASTFTNFFPGAPDSTPNPSVNATVVGETI